MDYIFEDVVPEENRIEQHVIENLRSEEDLMADLATLDRITGMVFFDYFH